MLALDSADSRSVTVTTLNSRAVDVAAGAGSVLVEGAGSVIAAVITGEANDVVPDQPLELNDAARNVEAPNSDAVRNTEAALVDATIALRSTTAVIGAGSGAGATYPGRSVLSMVISVRETLSEITPVGSSS